MSREGITVLTAGICETIQDRGRYGLLAKGFSPAGSMDQRSAFIANALVGNNPDCAVLEFAYVGPTLRFEQDALVCLTGAPFDVHLDETPIETYRAYAMPRGSILKVGRTTAGVYGYLAVAGGIAVTPILGSQSTSMRYGIGGRLRPGDTLPLAHRPNHHTSSGTCLASHDAYFRWDPTGPNVIRVVPQDPEGVPSWPALFEHKFTVGAESDRMGLRLETDAPVETPAADLTSEAVALGTIQVPADGRPIIAMADRQTTGGYFKAGVVAGVDIPRLAQCRPGTRLRFEGIDVEGAQKLLRRDARYLTNLARQLVCGHAKSQSQAKRGLCQQ